MRRLNKVGLGFFTTLFCAASIAACSASGNDVAGNPGGGGGAGSGDSGAVTDSSYGGSSDSGSQTDSGSSTDSGGTKIDSGGGTGPTDAGYAINLCDLSGDTTTYLDLAGFLAATDPSSCNSDDSCPIGQCCLDFVAAIGGGSISGLPGANACVTPLDLSSLGL